MVAGRLRTEPSSWERGPARREGEEGEVGRRRPILETASEQLMTPRFIVTQMRLPGLERLRGSCIGPVVAEVRLLERPLPLGQMVWVVWVRRMHGQHMEVCMACILECVVNPAGCQIQAD